MTPHYSQINDYVDAVQWNSILNQPVATQAADQYNVLRYTNQDAKIYGIDVSADRELLSNPWGNWGVSGALSHTTGKNKDTGSYLYNIMPFNARMALNHDRNGWTNQVEVVGVAAKNKVSSPRNDHKTAGYGLLNLNTGYQWQDIRIQAGIDNVLDKNYALPLGGSYMGQGKTMSINNELATESNWGTPVAGVGRSFYMGMNYKF